MKPSWNDNPTPRCYIDRIHNSSVLKNVSDSHDIPRSLISPDKRRVNFPSRRFHEIPRTPIAKSVHVSLMRLARRFNLYRDCLLDAELGNR